ncbi:MAG TPA: fumarylacetoacetate hydrolase family protein [Smithella sp.]|nr:fumarylacetoacetate hydrolase family protein [Smithella sp.]
MKLLNFLEQTQDAPRFGVVIKGHAVSFDVLARKLGHHFRELADIFAYLENLPKSMESASQLEKYGEAYLASFSDEEKIPLEKARILPPVPVPRALIDFGLSPRHLANSAATLLKHEFGVFGAMIAPIVKKRVSATARAKMLYYKGNHNAIIGDNETLNWPAYTSYLDIEPELAVITGNEKMPIAGYAIFNDTSARDVQFPEMIGMGPATSKDFDRSKGLGPFLVTPDEVGDPLTLKVRVTIGKRYQWRGSTAEYSAGPEKMLEYLKTVFSPLPGTVLGMGTIPDCTGLDNDLWILPGEKIEIMFDRLGILRQNAPVSLGKLQSSRWRNREELRRYY